MIDWAQTENGCEDELYLLSKEEIMDTDLFPDDDARMSDGSYWLRSLAGYGDKADKIDMYGFTGWAYKDKQNVGVRPAMWVNLN